MNKNVCIINEMGNFDSNPNLLQFLAVSIFPKSNK